MRYLSNPEPVEARQWQGPYGEETFDSLRTWGAPVERMALTDGLTLAMIVGGRSRQVRKGQWIIRYGDGEWGVLPDEKFRSRFRSQPSPDDDLDPFPGMAEVHLRRVAFRRRTGDTWEWRHAGLTRAELKAGEWVALYEMEVGT